MKHLLIIIIILLLFIALSLYLQKQKETFEVYPFQGRNPDGNFSCCGNMDWYLGKEKYTKECGEKMKMNFAKNELIEGLEINSEMIAKDVYAGNYEYYKQLQQCQEESEDWIASYNPAVCQINEEEVVAEANCKCIDKDSYKCTQCFPKVDMSKYVQ